MLWPGVQGERCTCGEQWQSVTGWGCSGVSAIYTWPPLRILGSCAGAGIGQRGNCMVHACRSVMLLLRLPHRWGVRRDEREGSRDYIARGALLVKQPPRTHL
jgi:hypothetical protein